jgi:hypothetical protein
MKKVYKRNLSLLLGPAYRAVVDFLRGVYPKKIWLFQINEKGCVLEARMWKESYRITNIGNEAGSLKRALQSISQETFFDIGACIGLYTVHAASRGAKVVAFESDRAIRSRLNCNISLNNLTDDVQIVEWAVSNKYGEITLCTDSVKGRPPNLGSLNHRGSLRVEKTLFRRTNGFNISKNIAKDLILETWVRL